MTQLPGHAARMHRWMQKAGGLLAAGLLYAVSAHAAPPDPLWVLQASQADCHTTSSFDAGGNNNEDPNGCQSYNADIYENWDPAGTEPGMADIVQCDYGYDDDWYYITWDMRVDWAVTGSHRYYQEVEVNKNLAGGDTRPDLYLEYDPKVEYLGITWIAIGDDSGFVSKDTDSAPNYVGCADPGAPDGPCGDGYDADVSLNSTDIYGRIYNGNLEVAISRTMVDNNDDSIDNQPAIFARCWVSQTSTIDKTKQYWNDQNNPSDLSGSRIDNTAGGDPTTWASFGPGAVPLDWGDAPDSYATDSTDASGEGVGPSHTITAGLQLGLAVDEDTDGFGDGIDNNGNATDDDVEGTTPDDEDGVLFSNTLSTDSSSYTIPATDITLLNTTGSGAALHAWIDFNRDGVFQTSEYATAAVANAATTPAADLVWSGLSGLVAGDTYARFRLSTDGALDATTPGGAALDGEVEDYSVAMVDPSASSCTCGFDDGLYTRATITADGDISDWATVLSDSDNISCDEIGSADRDHPVQSTGRDLLKFAFTWDSNSAYAYTERLASKSNIQKFIYYLDKDNNGLMETGEPVIVARWNGSNRNVSLYLGTYVPAASGGDPLEDGAGFADGYSLPGTLTGLPSVGNPDYSGTWGTASGTVMEWEVPWGALNANPDDAFSWHVSSTNSEPSAASLPNQIDDNMGGCGGCSASTQFSALTFIPDNTENVQPSVTSYLPHNLTNDGNGNDTFNLASTVSGDITPASINYYQDLGTIGQYDPGIDVLLTDTNTDTIPDTGLMISGGSINLLMAMEMPGAPVGQNAQVVTTATSAYLPSCGSAPPVTDSVTDTLTGGTQVSGTVWSDSNHDGIEDGGEAGIAGVTVVLFDSGATSCVSTQTDASGDYSFNGVADGSYQIIEAAGESVPAPAVCPSTGQDPAGYLSTTVNSLSITVAGGVNFTDQDFGDFHGSRFEGTVFEDNGSGGGTAHDGSINGSETGLTGVAVEANNGATLDSTSTDANGGFILWVADAASGANVDILAATPGSFISVSKSDGGAGDSAAATALDQISVVPVSGQIYSGLTFGDAREPAFAPDNSRSASPGSTLFYAHTFTAYTSGTVSFSTAGLNATPNVPGWNAVLYDDTNCSGTLEQGEPLHSTAIAMDADSTNQACLIVQVFVPASAPANAQYLVTLAATFSYDATSLVTVRNRTDLTTVGDSSLVLVKVVDKPTAQPGELLTYTITYTNAGSEALSNIVIDDKTPAFTSFNNASCILPLSANLTGCSASIQPAIGATGPIQWTFNPGDTLQSGSSGQLQYQVTVDN